eukprot:TRINITY_DN1194_c0_g1_i1.p1 TRINITY_DN1194_c0_g1~~TRINITY_DN1194_c0_g1_i1.p1  ORF type:complete len:371 (-),score=115.12 TRINITY_DN1194_c0_g1_i1:192-1304(-)
MSKLFLFTCLIFVIFFSNVNSQYDYWCDNMDSPEYKNVEDVLMSLFLNTDGGNWYLNDNWGNKSACICEWMFVDCKSTGNKLVNLFLTENNLKGQIPESFYTIDSFQKLYFSINSLSGNISTSISNLSNLSVLHFQYNKFVGKIPEEIGQLDNLVDLQLSNNKLGGYVPNFLYNSEDDLPSKIAIAGNEFWCAEGKIRSVSYNVDGMPSWCSYDNSTINYQCSPCFDGYPECRKMSECACNEKDSCCRDSWSSESHKDTCEIAASEYADKYDKSCDCELNEDGLPWYFVTLIIGITILGLGCIVGSGGFAVHYITQKHFQDFSWSNIKQMINGDKGGSTSGGYNLATGKKVEYDFNDFDDDDDEDDYYLN